MRGGGGGGGGGGGTYHGVVRESLAAETRAWYAWPILLEDRGVSGEDGIRYTRPQLSDIPGNGTKRGMEKVARLTQ